MPIIANLNLKLSTFICIEEIYPHNLYTCSYFAFIYNSRYSEPFSSVTESAIGTTAASRGAHANAMNVL